MANLTETEVALEKSAAHHVEDTLGHGAIVEAKHAADEEHAQTLWQALRDNRKAVFWSALISMVSFIEASIFTQSIADLCASLTVNRDGRLRYYLDG